MGKDIVKILLSCNHHYPAYPSDATSMAGRSTGSGNHIHDLVARGLAELGHDVRYLLKGVNEPLPVGVEFVSSLPSDVDIYHTMAYRDYEYVRVMLERKVPWLNSCHLDVRVRGNRRPPTSSNWIYASEAMARSFDSRRFVTNGMNPDDFIFDEGADDYLLFLCGLDYVREKGIETAFWLARQAGIELVVAGVSRHPSVIEDVREMCRKNKARFVGPVYGRHKSELMARARAVLHPSRLREACPLTIIEAMFSGTPVLSSDQGACPDMIVPGAGFVCSTDKDYLDAFNRLDEIDPHFCRAHAMEHFHYLRMARDYVREYEREINNPNFPEPPEPHDS